MRVALGALNSLAILSMVTRASPARADWDTWAVGPIAGVTIDTRYFPTYWGGANGTVNWRSYGVFSLGLGARTQFYYHLGDEGGSWGFQEDVSIEPRIDVFRRDSNHLVQPFLVVRAGVALVEKIPRAGSLSDAELLGGAIVGGTLGMEIQRVRVQASYLFPSAEAILLGFDDARTWPSRS